MATLTITSPWGPRIHPISGEPKHHNGIDISLPVGTPVRAVAAGVVERVADDHPVSGGHVVLEHPGTGYRSSYSHLSQVLASPGQRVRAGEIIGMSGGAAGAPGSGGSTGPHLHLAVFRQGADGRYHDVDPVPVIAWGSIQLRGRLRADPLPPRPPATSPSSVSPILIYGPPAPTADAPVLLTYGPPLPVASPVRI